MKQEQNFPNLADTDFKSFEDLILAGDRQFAYQQSLLALIKELPPSPLDLCKQD